MRLLRGSLLRRIVASGRLRTLALRRVTRRALLILGSRVRGNDGVWVDDVVVPTFEECWGLRFSGQTSGVDMVIA